MKKLNRHKVFDLGGVSTKRYRHCTGEGTISLVKEVVRRTLKSKISLN